MTYLPYIEDEDLRTAVTTVVNCILQTQVATEAAMYKNVIDPCSAIFDASVQGLTLDEWLILERTRQIQKTIQNQIGLFHQYILGSISGWERVGQGFDVCNQSRHIFAEIKNKYNTVKGSDQVGIYDYLLFRLDQPEYQGFTAYYVEIIPQGRKSYNKPFIPPDRKTRTIRPKNENIRQISGQAFYDLATGEQEALSMLFDVLPDVISDVSGLNKLSEQQKISFRSLFDRAF